MSENDGTTAYPDWPWPDSLDALQAAPAHHKRLLENERVRVIHTHILPGDIVPLHTHRWCGVAHVISTSDFIRRDHSGNIVFDSREAVAQVEASAVQWLKALPPHTVENLGTSPISVIVVELKDSR